MTENLPERRDSWRKTAAACLFALMAVAGIQPFFLTIWTLDRTGLRRTLERHVESRSPGLEEFLDELVERTGSDDVIVFAAPPGVEDGWPSMRAAYRLAGRTFRLVEPGDREALSEATVIATWKTPARPPGFVEVLDENGGAIYRREGLSR